MSGHFDHTARATGAPVSGAYDGEHPSEAGAAARTSDPSMTEVADSDILRRDQDNDDGDSGSEMERRASQVQSLARRYSTQRSAAVPPGTNPFAADDEDSPMNPNSKSFSARTWAKGIVDMVQSSGSGFRTSGIAFQNLDVFGHGQATDYQKTVPNIWLSVFDTVRNLFGQSGGNRINILQGFDGVVHNGEMLIVLGPPGSGCSTFLKTVSGETNGLNIDDKSYFNYQGITAKEMHSQHRGEAVYTAEVDVHFPMLTVGDTLTFAAQARRPRHLPAGLDKEMFSGHLRDVVMAMFGISHTYNTRVGNEYVRGVSGGERKRVTIAEAALSGAPLQCWDNSTRGLDSANAIEFCKTLRLQTELFSNTACVSIYQAPQSAYDLFDKTLVIYEGYQIFFGRANEAKQYFIDLGFECPPRATTPDFLTSMTAPNERIVRDGFKGRAPNTPEEFARCWKASAHYQNLQAEIEQYKQLHPLDGADAEAFRAHKQGHQAKGQRPKSPYTLSFLQQINLTLWRAWRRLVGSPGMSLFALIGNFAMALVISSIFYNMQETTASFFQRGVLLFFALLTNAFSSALEILTLYAQRPIVEKHSRYALYHPSAEAVASMICDLPYKISNTIVFNITLYFMTNLRREAGPFFFFLLIMFTSTLTMSMIFRTIASSSRTLSQAMVPAALFILFLVIFTGFVIPVDYMLGWCRWLNYLDPLAYAFEALLTNEFQGRQFDCSQFIPPYPDVDGVNRVCSEVGAQPGQDFVDGDVYMDLAYSYQFSHRWRNFGIILAFLVFFLFTYILASELVSEKKSKGEVLLFRRGYKPAALREKGSGDEETGSSGAHDGQRAPADDEKGAGFIQKQTSIFHWSNVCYDVKIKGNDRRILDHVDGWVKPGTLTALMGVSGAGKTTLLDCLANRVSMGVITGEMLVDGFQRDDSFQRKTGYVQQQDLHLETTTVREALTFSALLRQPAHVPRAEKLAYVDEVIKLLDMDTYADAVVGVPGEGLNVEQRKRLTIGVELAAKPPLLLFVDEPTSGLDSQTSWAILDLLEKLTKAGQAILCTIHQPSAMLFQRFDRLLFLAKGGRTVYFGDIGENSAQMISYFERTSGRKCPPDANPAEWMLEVIGAAPGSSSDVDWFDSWRNSPEFAATQTELQRLKDERIERPATNTEEEKASYREFAAPLTAQLSAVLSRVFQQYWRTPSYIYAKASLCILVSLFIGFVFFDANNTQQGLQNQMFSIFLIFTIFGQLVQQTMPYFVIQRSLYEVRERPSKVYSWKVFILSQILVELPWNSLMAVLMFLCWYYPIGLNNNAIDAGQTHERGILIFLFLWLFLIFTSTFTDLVIAGFDTAETGGNAANLMFTMCLLFCGVIASEDQMPGFWIFMYRVSPFTYIVSGMLSTAVANTNVECADNEWLRMEPASGTCEDYLSPLMEEAGGYLRPGTEDNTSSCEYCPMDSTNDFLSMVNIDYANRWRDWGITWAYIVFNVVGALFVYWVFRVPDKKLFSKNKKG